MQKVLNCESQRRLFTIKYEANEIEAVRNLHSAIAEIAKYTVRLKIQRHCNTT